MRFIIRPFFLQSGWPAYQVLSLSFTLLWASHRLAAKDSYPAAIRPPPPKKKTGQIPDTKRANSWYQTGKFLVSAPHWTPRAIKLSKSNGTIAIWSSGGHVLEFPHHGWRRADWTKQGGGEKKLHQQRARGLRQTSHSAMDRGFLPPFFFGGCWCNFFSPPPYKTIETFTWHNGNAFSWFDFQRLFLHYVRQACHKCPDPKQGAINFYLAIFFIPSGDHRRHGIDQHGQQGDIWHVDLLHSGKLRKRGTDHAHAQWRHNPVKALITNACGSS